jgi:ankyrin repeat protein
MLTSLAAAFLAAAIAVSAGIGLARAGSADDKALLDAAFDLNIPAVKAALAKGANPNAYDGNKLAGTPLSDMALGGLSEKQKLINAGLARDQVAKSINGKAIEVARILLTAGARLGAHDKDILHFPISAGNLGLVALLIANGASTKGRMSDGYTPAETAKNYDQEGIYNLLISHGGNPVDEQSSIQLAFVKAAFVGRIAVMEAAIEAGAQINGRDAAKNTALAVALEIPVISPNQVAAISWLLDHGADTNLPDKEGNPPLHNFVWRNTFNLSGNKGPELRQFAEDTLASLLKAGAKISGVDSAGQTPLHIAAQIDNVRAAEILIKEGAKIKPKDRFGRTPLDWAQSAAMIKLLKENGATEQ